MADVGCNMSYRVGTFPNVKTTSELILGAISLICGCTIYLLFRSKSINIYQWCNALGLSNKVDTLRKLVQGWEVPDFVKFSIPDGLYCASYILIIDAIWRNEKPLKYFVVALIPLVAIANEVLQYFGMTKGTFDWYDIICYVTPLLLYFISTNLKIKRL